MMAKKLKSILTKNEDPSKGGYSPKSGDERKFVAKHVIAKHDDANGNDDDVFNGSKIKPIDRYKEAHGYNPGQDEAVYEEVEDLDEEDAYTHQVVHAKTGNVVGKYKSLKAASRAADKKDNAYGAVAHRVVPIGEELDLDEGIRGDVRRKMQRSVNRIDKLLVKSEPKIGKTRPAYQDRETIRRFAGSLSDTSASDVLNAINKAKKKVNEDVELDEATHVVYTKEVSKGSTDKDGPKLVIKANNDKHAWQVGQQKVDKMHGHYIDKIEPIKEDIELTEYTHEGAVRAASIAKNQGKVKKAQLLMRLAKALEGGDNVTAKGIEIELHNLKEGTSLLEKVLTRAEKKKREEIAQAMEREHPGMDMSKKMAIATAAAKKVAEEADINLLSLYAELDEETRQLMVQLIDEGRKDELIEFANMLEEENNGDNN